MSYDVRCVRACVWGERTVPFYDRGILVEDCVSGKPLRTIRAYCVLFTNGVMVSACHCEGLCGVSGAVEAWSGGRGAGFGGEGTS